MQGDKDLKVRFYNIEDALDEKSWIAGIISETFGRKVGISFEPLQRDVSCLLCSDQRGQNCGGGSCAVPDDLLCSAPAGCQNMSYLCCLLGSP